MTLPQTRHPDALDDPQAMYPKQPIRGRIVAMLDEGTSTLLKLRVPRNGLWWAEDVEKGTLRTLPPDGFDDTWVEDWGEDWGALARPRLGDWVESDRLRLRRVPPLTPDPVFEAVRVDAIPQRGEGQDSFPSLHLRFPGVPWLDTWFREALNAAVGILDTALDVEPAADAPWRPVFLCSCSDPSCGSVMARIERNPDGNGVVWHQLTAIDGEVSLHLGPAIALRAQALGRAQTLVAAGLPGQADQAGDG